MHTLDMEQVGDAKLRDTGSDGLLFHVAQLRRFGGLHSTARHAVVLGPQYDCSCEAIRSLNGRTGQIFRMRKSTRPRTWKTLDSQHMSPDVVAEAFPEQVLGIGSIPGLSRRSSCQWQLEEMAYG